MSQGIDAVRGKIESVNKKAEEIGMKFEAGPDSKTVLVPLPKPSTPPPVLTETERLTLELKQAIEQLDTAEENKIATKAAVKKWIDDFIRAHGRAPGPSDNEKGRDIFMAHSKVTRLTNMVSLISIRFLKLYFN